MPIDRHPYANLEQIRTSTMAEVNLATRVVVWFRDVDGEVRGKEMRGGEYSRKSLRLMSTAGLLPPQPSGNSD